MTGRWSYLPRTRVFREGLIVYPDNRATFTYNGFGSTARRGFPDYDMPQFGLFAGGGWAFGLTENSGTTFHRYYSTTLGQHVSIPLDGHVIPKDVYLWYETAPIGASRTFKLRTSDLDTAPETGANLTLIVGGVGSIFLPNNRFQSGFFLPQFNSLHPFDKASFEHDFTRRNIREREQRGELSAYRALVEGIKADERWLNHINSYQVVRPIREPGEAEAEFNRRYAFFMSERSYRAYANNNMPAAIAALKVQAFYALADPYTGAFPAWPMIPFRLMAEWDAFNDLISDIGPVDFAALVGGFFGSRLGDALVNPSSFGERILATTLNNIGVRMGAAIAAGATSGNVLGSVVQAAQGALSDFLPQLGTQFEASAVGTVSSYLTLELGEALGLDGFLGDLTQTIAQPVLQQVVQNAWTAGANLLSNLNTDKLWSDLGNIEGLGSLVQNAVGAFIGARLGNLVVQPQTQSGAILGSLGAAYWATQTAAGYAAIASGNYVITGGWGTAIVEAFAKSLGAAAGPIGAIVGAFFGFVIWTAIGNLFGRRKPRIPTANAETVLQIPNARYELGAVTVANNGDRGLVTSMATAARDTLNGMIATLTRGDENALVSNTFSPTQVYGHTGNQLWVRYGGPQAPWQYVASADEAVDKGVLFALPATQIIGGDLFLKRAIYNLAATNDPTRPKAPNIAALAGDLQIAEDYGFYLKNRAVIDAMIAEPYTSMKLVTVDFLAYGKTRANWLTEYRADTQNKDPQGKDLAAIRAWAKGKWDGLSQAQRDALAPQFNVGANIDTAFYDANKAFMTRAMAKDQVALNAADQAFYSANQVQVDRIISRIAVTQFAAAWIITLQRAAELQLDKTAVSDFYGGAKGFIDSLGLTLLGQGVDYERVSFNLEGSTLRTSFAAVGAPSGEIEEFRTEGFPTQAGYQVAAIGNNGVGDDFTDARGSATGVIIDDYRLVEDVIYHDPDPFYFGDEWEEYITFTYTGGNDLFIGGSFADVLKGRLGRDWLDGQAGDDWIEGNDDGDVLLGRAGRDALFGGEGDDFLYGGDGDETPAYWWSAPFQPGQGWGGLWGGAGHDVLRGGAGVDHSWGEDGNDIFIVEEDNGIYDWHEGGGGLDTASFENFASGITFDLNVRGWNSAAPADARGGGAGYAHNDGFLSVENLTGSNHADTLRGDEIANVLAGLSGADVLEGRQGDDTLIGGAGADTLNGGDGWDTASYHSAGAQILSGGGRMVANPSTAESSTGVWVDFTSGEAFGGDADGDAFTSVEHLNGSNFADTFKGAAGYNELRGGKGDDWLIASAGGDLYEGGEGFDTVDFSDLGPLDGGPLGLPGQQVGIWVNIGGWLHGNHVGWQAGGVLSGIEHVVGTEFVDHIHGDNSDQVITGGKGNDYLRGWDGSDTYVFNRGDGADTIVASADGADSVVFGEGITWADIYVTPTWGTYSVSLKGTGDSVTLIDSFIQNNHKIKLFDMNGYGAVDVNALNWVVNGGAGNDVLHGSGLDWMFGHEGNDTLYGAWNGGYETGSNLILGGRGADTIVTSVGDDTFVFERGDGADQITDSGGRDMIVFGPNVEADDVIFQIVGRDLYIGVRDLSDPTKSACQVADRIRIHEGATRWLGYWVNISGEKIYDLPQFNTIEHVLAGGATIDLTKLGLVWHEEEVFLGDLGGGWGGGFIPPLVFDLGGDGVDLIGVEQSDVVFRPDNGGPMYRIGWVDGQDGILALDRNKSGAIDSLLEITFTRDKKGAKTDLEGLAGHDSNGDGRLDEQDKIWVDLRIWRDVNGNGLGAGKELLTMAQAGITGFTLKPNPTGFDTRDGIDNAVVNTTVFDRADGTQGTAYDVKLATRLAHTKGYATGEARPEWKAATVEGSLGRVSPSAGALGRASVAIGARAPDQKLSFERGNLAREGKADLPAIVPRRSSMAALAEDLARGAPRASAGRALPIALDLAGDGLDLVGPSASPLRIDLDADGWADQVGWIGASDAILGLDRDGDGRIAALNEISFVADLPDARTDLEGLRAFDSDGDGELTSSDDAFASFYLWRDLNQDGRSSADELVTLAEAGVARLSLTPDWTIQDSAPDTESSILGATTVTMTNGAVRTGYDVALGSLSGLALAAQGATADPAVASRRPDPVAAGSGRPRMNPWAMDTDVRRALAMGPSDVQTEADAWMPPLMDGDAMTPDDVMPAPRRAIGEDALGASRDNMERVSLNPSEERRRAGGEAPVQPLAPDVANGDAADADAILAGPQPRIAQRTLPDRRWWMEGGPSLFQPMASLGELIGALEQQRLADGDDVLGRNRALPAFHRADLLIQSIAAFAPQAGGEVRRSATQRQQRGDALAIPSSWIKEQA